MMDIIVQNLHLASSSLRSIFRPRSSSNRTNARCFSNIRKIFNTNSIKTKLCDIGTGDRSSFAVDYVNDASGCINSSGKISSETFRGLDLREYEKLDLRWNNIITDSSTRIQVQNIVYTRERTYNPPGRTIQYSSPDLTVASS